MLLGVVLAFGISARAQSMIDFSRDTIDFGRVTPRKFLMDMVDIYNRGNDTLVLQKIETSCGCTAATADAMRLPFMGTATLRVSMNIDNRSGRFTQWVRVHSNDPRRPEHDIFLTVDIVPQADSSAAK